MTEGAPAPRPPRRPSAWPVITGALALFLVVLAFLAVQLRTGRDPALGAGSAPAKRVIVRRVEDRVVITRVLPGYDDSEDDDGGSSGAVAVSSAAPPAPQPASPPVSTGSS